MSQSGDRNRHVEEWAGFVGASVQEDDRDE